MSLLLLEAAVKPLEKAPYCLSRVDFQPHCPSAAWLVLAENAWAPYPIGLRGTSLIKQPGCWPFCSLPGGLSLALLLESRPGRKPGASKSSMRTDTLTLLRC